ncbi:hypothetical protein HYPBUDRAFT_5607 [Hyphopichia burtonii NRRL Y-1933]|uniref:Uncharacterized protein n=1 Tax=Hyphopichia burtonii NRRL Y-1933 TaxID=984485 RepID=A0A1E4RKG5_9ASCO|nr:hypothetical protein HYPBUDRAFT_5607 [Hyphopichia burtonii NRRL Y-1933]ODV67768.1 hypothetical protein HYPBUDRAFT_5607 [Hyphopichia burtonii NRRL Y-1933]
MDIRKLSKQNIDILQNFIVEVEKKSFGMNKSQILTTSPPHSACSVSLDYDDILNQRFNKYKACLSQPFYIDEFYGSAKRRKEWVVVKLVPSNDPTNSKTLSINTIKLIRTFNMDYKLLFDDSSYFTITSNGTKKLFYFNEPSLSDDKLFIEFSPLLSSGDSDTEINIQTYSAQFSAMSLDSSMGPKVFIEQTNTAFDGNQKEDIEMEDVICQSLVPQETGETLQSIIFLSTGNSNKELKSELRNRIMEEDTLLSPESEDMESKNEIRASSIKLGAKNEL